MCQPCVELILHRMRSNAPRRGNHARTKKFFLLVDGAFVKYKGSRGKHRLCIIQVSRCLELELNRYASLDLHCLVRGFRAGPRPSEQSAHSEYESFSESAVLVTNSRTGVSADDLSQFKLWVQYAAAAYCHDSYTADAGSKLSCSAGNCPEVEAAGASIVYDFSK